MERGLRRKLSVYEDAFSQEYKEQIAKDIDNCIIDILSNDIKEFVDSGLEYDLANIIYHTSDMGTICEILEDLSKYKDSEMTLKSEFQ